ncbi:cell division ATP-binding protein FtsE [Oxobacter pfennigii]|uniref:Cell division ATP-binding protein FtsE n=1 Tax=Oxobacter pfennigii TaxID=36849 RepID=A0A0P8W6C8_9CLOT|nr:ATP-binding cassette domain-containing protein [Oxobacter pfennigii]KPU44244.1 cell division ATP-binding protein FtsE [Oxobacter pfennigii]
MIEAKDVSLIYSDGTIGLKNVNLEIIKGSMVYITGPSGSGKTSLLKLLMGMEFPTSGVLNVLGQAIKKEDTSGILKLRQRMGPVFQEFKLIKGRTAVENVMLGMRFLNFTYNQIKEDSISALKEVGLFHKAQSLVENLSYGECQRVAIARAVARRPELILADEPTGNLDTDNAVKILNLLASFKNDSRTVIITTHATHLIEGKKGAMYIRISEGSIHCERLEEA